VTLRRLRLLSLLGVVLFVVLLELARSSFHSQLASWPARIALDVFVALGFVLYIYAVFHRLEKLQAEVDLRHQELQALHAAVLDIHGEPEVEQVLQRVVDRARQLAGASYGALTVIGEDDRIRSFLTSGLTEAERRLLGDPPSGHGLLGIALREGRRLRVADVSGDPRSAGFPPHHPPMKSLLAVPIPSRGAFRGNLYLTEKAGGQAFTTRDEETLVRFASAAGLAIDNAELDRQLRFLAVAEERVRIAHELHDGVAQVLAYVNTKAQAVGEFLDSGRVPEAQEQLRQLAKAAREVYADAREGILGLRSGGDGGSFGDVLGTFLDSWHQQSGIAVEGSVSREDLGLGPGAELQLMRILQEALANVRKHSGADRVLVALERRSDKVVALVEDSGAGFDPGRLGRSGFPRFGLATMRERAESAGALLEIDSRPGKGTRVRVELPVEGLQ